MRKTKGRKKEIQIEDNLNIQIIDTSDEEEIELKRSSKEIKRTWRLRSNFRFIFLQIPRIQLT